MQIKKKIIKLYTVNIFIELFMGVKLNWIPNIDIDMDFTSYQK